MRVLRNRKNAVHSRYIRQQKGLRLRAEGGGLQGSTVQQERVWTIGSLSLLAQICSPHVGQRSGGHRLFSPLSTMLLEAASSSHPTFFPQSRGRVAVPRRTSLMRTRALSTTVTFPATSLTTFSGSAAFVFPLCFLGGSGSNVGLTIG